MDEVLDNMKLLFTEVLQDKSFQFIEVFSNGQFQRDFVTDQTPACMIWPIGEESGSSQMSGMQNQKYIVAYSLIYVSTDIKWIRSRENPNNIFKVSNHLCNALIYNKQLGNCGDGVVHGMEPSYKATDYDVYNRNEQGKTANSIGIGRDVMVQFYRFTNWGFPNNEPNYITPADQRPENYSEQPVRWTDLS